MPDESFHHSIFLTGPTAVGKTAVGVQLAQKLGAEVIALDSMTLYRGMDVGTAKPTLVERGGVPHHLIDILDPWEASSVADYRTRALQVSREVEARGRRVLFVGGTALYLKAMLRGLFEGPGADLTLREALESEANRLGDLAMHAKLERVDPSTATRLHPNDRRRVIRALEVFESTGRPLSAHQVEHAHAAPLEVPVFALERPRGELFARIDHRVEQMFREGLVEEVRRLRSNPKPPGLAASQAVGYREVADLLEARGDLPGAIEATRLRTRQFAKRQATWFRGLAEVRAFPIEPGESAEAIATRLFERIMRSD